MIENTKNIAVISIEQELKKSYLDYAMSVIVGRALPDVRDGLKPVHRRVLYAMYELKNDWNKAYKKSARIVGDVIGKYHPHGDTAVYDTIVRMAQSFSLRYLLVDGQGNFGSIDGDSPAAMRYTEIRMSKIAHSLLSDIEKETVDFIDNYDGTEQVPVILPTRVPNLLVNGTSGIAVGMATNIPAHNLAEVIDATIALLEDSTLELNDLMEFIKGPDFPTGGIINGRNGIVEAYATGRGKIYVRGRVSVETDDKNNRDSIVITELPYQVNKARLLEKIAELVKNKQLEGITGLRDESDKDGMRVVIELRRGENAEVIINQLYSQTQLQTTFSINMVALDGEQPVTFTLKQMLMAFIKHRREVVTRRTLFELKKAKERAHILEGLTVALANIDEMIALIKAAPSPLVAKEKLLERFWQSKMVDNLLALADDKKLTCPNDMTEPFGLFEQGYRLSSVQAQAILELRLHRLTGLEQDKIYQEYQSIIDAINALLLILKDPERLANVIKEELNELREAFTDERRTEIQISHEEFDLEDLIAPEEMVVTLSRQGYIKSQSLSTYQAQRRGGKGKSATQVKEEDIITTLLVANSHDTLLCFSDKGKVYWIKIYQLPQANRNSRGKPIINLLSLSPDEKISAVLPIKAFTDEQFVFMATAQGIVKKTSLKAFINARTKGVIALNLAEQDQLIGTVLTDGNKNIMLLSDAGKAVRFEEGAVRDMGRLARGVIGMRLQEKQRVISLLAVEADTVQSMLVATANGYGKCTAISAFRLTGRGTRGVVSIQVSERNGNVIGACLLEKENELMLISNAGTLVRIHAADVPLLGRATQGVRLIRLSANEQLVEIEPIYEIDDVLDELEDNQIT